MRLATALPLTSFSSVRVAATMPTESGQKEGRRGPALLAHDTDGDESFVTELTEEVGGSVDGVSRSDSYGEDWEGDYGDDDGSERADDRATAAAAMSKWPDSIRKYAGRLPEMDEAEWLVSVLEEICISDELSLRALGEVIELIQPCDVRESPFLHHVCNNKSVSLEIVEFLLGNFLDAACISTNVFCGEFFNTLKTAAYPIHLACNNEYCPDSVVELLAMRFPPALCHLCEVGEGIDRWLFRHVDRIKGLPLHYYLGRKLNVDAATVRMLVKQYPGALSASDDGYGFTPIHVAINNEEMGSDVVQVLLDNGRELTRQRDYYGNLPIHSLSRNEELDEAAALDILKVLTEADPQSVREWAYLVDGDLSDLPIHFAVQNRSPDFCKMLIDVCPESLNMESENNGLPIHIATEVECRCGRIDLLQYMLDRDPQKLGVNAQGLKGHFQGRLPIHVAACTTEEHQVDVIRFLLSQGPTCASKATSHCSSLPLHIACSYSSNLDAIKLLFDAYPEAIVAVDDSGHTPIDAARIDMETDLQSENDSSVVDFLEAQLSLGWLLLHRAIHSGASVGTIEYLVDRNPGALLLADLEGDLPLHIACRGGDCKVVNYLLGKCASSASEREAADKLPVHLLCESSNVNRQSPEYIETIQHLLLAHPMALCAPEILVESKKQA